MPNYNKSFIYKLSCGDDCYIGSTTDINQRIRSHRFHSKTETSSKFNQRIYVIMREYGGLDNFNYEVLEEYSCNTKYELELKEREYIDNIKPSMNSFIPTRSKKEYAEIHTEDRKVYHSKWYQENKEKQNKKIECDICNKFICKVGMNRHKKSMH